MFRAADSPYLVPFDGSFRLRKASTTPPDDAPSKARLQEALEEEVGEISKLQARLHAADRHAVLFVFQAMDAAGKDSTIRAVLTGVDPAGCQVQVFKRPSTEELDHDFLWRCWCRLPERGRIGVFNRSYYEEVLVVRVHPELLEHQRLPHVPPLGDLWKQRYESIVDMERHLARNGVVVVKFWLNVSRDEQRTRFLSRLDEPEKSWKFQASDIEERAHWDAYQEAYQDALAATSRSWAPWYAIPADHKPWMRLQVARIMRDTLEALDPRYPRPDAGDAERRATLRAALLRDG